MSAAITVLSLQRRYIRAFRAAGATSKKKARSLAELGCRETGVRRRLTRAGVLPEGDSGRFYLDEKVTDGFLERQRMRALVAVTVAVLVVLGIWAYHALGG